MSEVVFTFDVGPGLAAALGENAIRELAARPCINIRSSGRVITGELRVDSSGPALKVSIVIDDDGELEREISFLPEEARDAPA